MASSSSSSSDHSPLRTIRKATDPEVRTVCKERSDERWILNQRFIFPDDVMFFHLVQTGLADKMIKIFQDAYPTMKKKPDYKRLRVDEDTNDEEDEGNSSTDVCSSSKRIKRSNIVMVDASTQTDHNF
jgi:hypothetical protein